MALTSKKMLRQLSRPAVIRNDVMAFLCCDPCQYVDWSILMSWCVHSFRHHKHKNCLTSSQICVVWNSRKASKLIDKSWELADSVVRIEEIWKLSFDFATVSVECEFQPSPLVLIALHKNCQCEEHSSNKGLSYECYGLRAHVYKFMRPTWGRFYQFITKLCTHYSFS